MRGLILDLAFWFAVVLLVCGLVYPEQTTEAVRAAVNDAQKMLRAVLP